MQLLELREHLAFPDVPIALAEHPAFVFGQLLEPIPVVRVGRHQRLVVGQLRRNETTRHHLGRRPLGRRERRPDLFWLDNPPASVDALGLDETTLHPRMAHIAWVGGESNFDADLLLAGPHTAGQVGVLELGEMCRFINPEKNPLCGLVPINVALSGAITKPEVAIPSYSMKEDPALATGFISRELECDEVMVERVRSEDE